MAKNRDGEFKALWEKALAAGQAAANETIKRFIKSGPAYAVRNADLLSGQPYGEPVGYMHDLCGFAHSTLRPANSPFANWIKKNKLGSKDSYAGGLWLNARPSAPGPLCQSITINEDFCSEFSRVLREAGYHSYMTSRLD